MPELDYGQDSDSDNNDDDEIIFDILMPNQQGTGSAGQLDETLPMSSRSSTLNYVSTQPAPSHQGQHSPPDVNSQLIQTSSADPEITFGVRGPSNPLDDTRDTIPMSDQDIPVNSSQHRPYPQDQTSDLSEITFFVRGQPDATPHHLNDTHDTLPMSDQDIPLPPPRSSAHNPPSLRGQTSSDTSEVTFNFRRQLNQRSSNTLDDTQDTLPMSDQDIPPPPPRTSTHNPPQGQTPSDTLPLPPSPPSPSPSSPPSSPPPSDHDGMPPPPPPPPPPQTNTPAISPALRALLPDDWNQGSDGLGK